MAWSQLVQVLAANTGIFTQILKKVLNFFAARFGYQQPKSGIPSKFQVVYRLPLIYSLASCGIVVVIFTVITNIGDGSADGTLWKCGSPVRILSLDAADACVYEWLY